MTTKGILFLCVANSARSQLAEGVARKMFGDSVRVQSAGSTPSRVSPHAIAVLQEIGVDTSKQTSKSVSTISPDGVDLVITLCAEEVCPVFLHKAERLHWPLPDPGLGGGSDEEILQRFRNTRDEIERRLRQLAIERGLMHSS